ncbi:winged helix-turn-helix domain-containing protein [Polaribacter sp. Asnod6-C07]|uniref:winged helix-turn-helix domain-containing protein n=1 Tax=Polaribacter sp. Asnod6-C07 TaxID=3160582 RepID=UPI00386C53DF
MIQKKLFSLFLFLLLPFFIWSFYPQKKENIDFSKKVKIALRQVGNQLLLTNKDSTSLVLPIKEIDDLKFSISFEKELFFEPSILVKSIKNNLEKTSIHKNYRVEVVECLNNEVAYSYEINSKKEKTIIPCAGRVLPIKCYIIDVQFLEKKESIFNYNLLFYFFIPLIIGILYRMFFRSKKQKNEQENNNNKPLFLGSFIFYPEQNKLVQKAKEIALSKKECELLKIFVLNVNQVIKREELTKKVWEDNGVIVGRSLDTYISKLRKKLQEDKNIKLTNVHGVGYKLETK